MREEDQDLVYHKQGFLREVNTNDIAEMKFNYFMSGALCGGLVAGLSFAYYFMR